MINRHEFQQVAKKFRGGRISLEEFTAAVFTGEDDPSPDQIESEGIHLRLPVRPANSHKGDFGRVLLIGGSSTMPGAIALSGMAAIRSGAGVAVVVTPNRAKRTVASFSPCLMTTGVPSVRGFFSKNSRRELMQHCDWADAVAIGPGMGCEKSCQKIVQAIYEQIEQPLVVDADALNCLADSKFELSNHAGPRILTPHPLEFSRLVNEKFERRTEMESRAVELARRSQTIVLLKGASTLVTDGTRNYHNHTGNAGMATAGSGDVLTGMIVSFIGQKMDCFSAAQNGCCLHGIAGDRYAKRTCAASMVATDLIDELPDAMLEMATHR